MCFTADYDWYAEVIDRSEPTATGKVICDECRMGIPRGAKYHHVHMEQYENCHDCACDACDCPPLPCGGKVCEDGDCRCEKPNLGETFDWNCCDNCHRFLEAVRVAEEEVGCGGMESNPPLTKMIESIQEGGAEEAKRYWKKAVQMHPELLGSGYLVWLWRKMFGHWNAYHPQWPR